MIKLLILDFGSSACGVLLFIPFAVVLAAMIYGVIRSGNDRRNDLAALASRLGFTFKSGVDGSFADRYQQIGLFTMGSRRRASNMMTGVMELGGNRVPVLSADYSYVIQSGTGTKRRTRTHHVGVVMAHLPWNSLPEFSLRDETVMDRLTAAIGFDDIDYESADFSRKFHIKCRDRRFASDLIDPQMMDFMLSSTTPSMEIEGQVVCLQIWGIPDADEVERTISWIGRFLDHWPEHLTERLTEEASR